MPNYQFPLLDSHIHLWPPEAADSRSHEWMVPGGPLTKEYSISHYVEASAPYFSTASEHYTPSSPSQSSATTERRSHASSSEDSFKGTFEQSQHPAHGFIYIETDRTRPDFTSIASDYIHALSELEFLRRIVEGRPSEEDTFLPHHRKLLKGIVAFAPMIEWKRLDAYLKKAEEVAGAETWALVRGFRFLLQEMNSDHEMIRSALRDAFWGSLQLLGKKGYSFDVGVDAKRAGVWQVEFAVEMVEKTWQGVPRRERTAFIFDHLGKPDLEHSPPTKPEEKENFTRWANSTRRLGVLSKTGPVYMKLSGGFSELPSQADGRTLSRSEIVEMMRPWLDVLFEAFEPDRIMFGSDWPVCNVKGPGDELSWSKWRDVVESILDIWVKDEDREQIWWKTAADAYRIWKL